MARHSDQVLSAVEMQSFLSAVAVARQSVYVFDASAWQAVLTLLQLARHDARSAKTSVLAAVNRTQKTNLRCMQAPP